MGCGSSRTVAVPQTPVEQQQRRPSYPPPARPRVTFTGSEPAVQAPPVEFPGSGAADGPMDDAVEMVRAYVVRGSVTECFGFGLGTTDTKQVFVTDLVEGGNASGSLAVADRVDKLNGMPTSALDFESILRKVASSLVLMLEISRLRGASSQAVLAARAEAAVQPTDGSSGDQDAGRATRNLTIADLMPHLTMVSRRPSVGRAALSKRPELNPITEGNEDIAEAPDGDGAAGSEGAGGTVAAPTTVAVVLQRPTTEEPFGFGLAETADARLFVYKISSNIWNWGMLQIGDIILEIDGVETTDMSSEAASKLINAGLRLTLTVVRNADAIEGGLNHTARGSVSLAIPPTLLMNKLNAVKQERASEEQAQADTAGQQHVPPPPQQSPRKGDGLFEKGSGEPVDTSFLSSIAGIISASDV